ncbi:MAG: HAD-IA family hydrolase [Anaerolineales bacterium]
MVNSVFKGLFLDLDGTLINSAPMVYEVMKELFQKHNLGPISKSMMAKFAGLPPKLFFDTLDHNRKDLFLEETVALEKKHRALAPPYPEVTSLISTISDNGYPLAVISSQSGLEMDLVKISYDFAPRIDFWISADDVQNHKPHPEGIQIALDFFNISPDKILFVGDTEYDIKAGKSAGVHTGAAMWGGHTKETLTASNPDYIFQKPSQILTHFTL